MVTVAGIFLTSSSSYADDRAHKNPLESGVINKVAFTSIPCTPLASGVTIACMHLH